MRMCFPAPRLAAIFNGRRLQSAGPISIPARVPPPVEFSEFLHHTKGRHR